MGQSQMSKMLQSNIVNVAIVKNKAYWVKDNVFYTAKINSYGQIDIDNAEPVDVFSMSEIEAKNLLKILDSLKD